MAQPAHLELHAGADRRYRLILCAFWLFAAAVLCAYGRMLPWPVLIAACALLLWLRPVATRDPVLRPGKLFLYRNGSALVGERSGTWGGDCWSCRWFSVLRIRLPRRPVRVLVCASLNRTSDYRRPLVWTRYRPVSPACLGEGQ